MSLKLGPERVTRQVPVKVGFPDDLFEQVEFYQAQIRASKPGYVIVEATRAFLEADKEFQRLWAQHVAAKATAGPTSAREKRSEKQPVGPETT